MGLRDLRLSLRRARPAVDDAYIEWLAAHSRCAEALRAWRAAAPERRAVAYRRYRASLEREETAAARLQRCHGLLSEA